MVKRSIICYNYYGDKVIKINNKGFTLVELIAVIVLLSLVTILIMPSLINLSNNNRQKEYTSYEDMMVEYAKVYPNYKSKTCISLLDLKMQKINESTTCSGYVIIDTMTPYLSCTKNGENVYKTEGYDASKSC